MIRRKHISGGNGGEIIKRKFEFSWLSMIVLFLFIFFMFTFVLIH